MDDRVPASSDLERRLRSLGGRDDLFPATPGVAVDVGAVIRSRQPENALRRKPPRFGWRLVAIAALVVLTALVAAIAAPTSRTAIADFFGIDGIRIELGREDSIDVPDAPTSIGGSLLLGERATLDEVPARVPFAVLVPTDAIAGEPDELYLNQRSDVTVVGLLYEASDVLPEVGQTDVGMLLLEIEVGGSDITFVTKSLGRDGRLVDTLSINGQTGYWIENGVLTVEPIDSLMLDDLGMESRRSGNVLIWSDGGITYRLESALPMEDAVRIAESLEPVGGTGNPPLRRGV